MNAELQAARERIERLERALMCARTKLTMYREVHGGEYVGGMEYTQLIAYIDDALGPYPFAAYLIR